MNYCETKIKLHKTDLHMARCEDMLPNYSGPRRGAIDLGAHVGTRSLWLMTDGGFEKVWAVEPAIDNFNLLCSNIIENGFAGKIIPVLGAVDIDCHLCNFKYAGINRGQCSICYREGAAPTAYSMMTIALWDLVFNIKSPIDFLKMDIEGSEYSIFSTLVDAKTALRGINCLFIETHGPNNEFFDDKWFSELGYDPKDPNSRLMDQIKRCGFDHMELTDIGQIMAQRSSKDAL